MKSDERVRTEARDDRDTDRLSIYVATPQSTDVYNPCVRHTEKSRSAADIYILVECPCVATGLFFSLPMT
jgi:hypothetical protein